MKSNKVLLVYVSRKLYKQHRSWSMPFIQQKRKREKNQIKETIMNMRIKWKSTKSLENNRNIVNWRIRKLGQRRYNNSWSFRWEIKPKQWKTVLNTFLLRGTLCVCLCKTTYFLNQFDYVYVCVYFSLAICNVCLIFFIMSLKKMLIFPFFPFNWMSFSYQICVCVHFLSFVLFFFILYYFISFWFAKFVVCSIMYTHRYVSVVSLICVLWPCTTIRRIIEKLFSVVWTKIIIIIRIIVSAPIISITIKVVIIIYKIVRHMCIIE